MIYPPKLKKNSTIGIVTPSDIVEGKHIKELEFGINKLEEFGFDIFRSELFNIDEIRIKAKDLHNMFIDKKIDAIICAHGGDKSQEIIPYLDLDLIKNNPKIFMGMSDITPMLNHITAQTDLITFHGPDVRSIIGKGYFEKSLSEIERILIKGERNIGWYKDRKIIRKGVAKGRLVGGNLRCLLKLDDLNLFPDFENKILFLESLHCDEGELEEYFD